MSRDKMVAMMVAQDDDEPNPWAGDPCPTCGGYLGRHHHAPAYRPPVDGETRRGAAARRKANGSDREAWRRYMDARCAVCGLVRFNVVHEMDPDTSPEGPDYHADFAHHPFALRPTQEEVR